MSIIHLKDATSVDSTNPLPIRRGRGSTAFQASVYSNNITTAATVKAATAAKSIYITDLVISCGSAMDVQLQDDTGTPVVVMEQMYFAANSVVPMHFNTPLQVTSGKALQAISLVAANVSITVSGYVE